MITTKNDLIHYLDNLRGDFRAMDLEADSLHRYNESISLVQFTDGEQHQLIDPLAIDDLSPLHAFIKKTELWMHGADYDIVLLRSKFDLVPAMIWDTQIAARLIGMRKFGYQSLVEQLCGVEISKSSQKEDWSKRPLPDKMRDYAINDVFYLQEIVEKLTVALRAKGRYAWFKESCEVTFKKASERELGNKEPWRISGSGKLKPRALAYLHALWHWRDNEAREWDRPCFMVCGNKQLIEWTHRLNDGKKVSLPKHYRNKRVKRFLDAVNMARQLPDERCPQKLKKKGKRAYDENFDAKLNRILSKQAKLAKELDIDGSLIITRSQAEGIAGSSLDPSVELMQWQQDLLADVQ